MRGLPGGVASAGQGLLPAWLGALALAASLAGCATSSADPTPGPARMDHADRAAMEDDGLPAQAAPPAGIRQQPDDPREPFSRNYGAPPHRPARVSQLDEDALIARAITEHEMRRP